MKKKTLMKVFFIVRNYLDLFCQRCTLLSYLLRIWLIYWYMYAYCEMPGYFLIEFICCTFVITSYSFPDILLRLVIKIELYIHLYPYAESRFLFLVIIWLLVYFTVQYQMEMMRNLRHVNIDHLHVGWYQSTLFGSFISRAFVDSQFNYQHSIEESVVLIYGKEFQIMIDFHKFWV